MRPERAITWILQQVSRAASCHAIPGMPGSGQQGFPSANLLTLGPASTDPLGSNLVVATAAIRAQFGSRLASVYAPAIIASFGSGNARIDIRLVFPGGTARYRAVEQGELSARKSADAQLLANSQIAVSATARAQLLSGDIDPRLPQLLATMAFMPPGAASWTSSANRLVADLPACCARWTWPRWTRRRT